MVSALTQASGTEFHSGTVLTINGKTDVYTVQYETEYGYFNKFLFRRPRVELDLAAMLQI